VLETMYAEAPYTLLTRAMYILRTVAEFIPTMLGDLVPLPDSVAGQMAGLHSYDFTLHDRD
jgi:hypothetical protein